jgi:hypothetical protein
MSSQKPTPEELRVILDAHGKWSRGDADGSRANLTRANLTGADLTGAYLTGANLTGANLTHANLFGADLTRANLTHANLTHADLTRAYLTGANLSGAVGFLRERHMDLLILLDQPGPIRAYKLVTADGDSPIYDSTKLRYEVGATLEVANADTDPYNPCGIGIHVATLPWVLREWQPGWRVMLVEFTTADIACIPTATDGKFRLHRCTVVGQKDISALVEGRKETEAQA